MTDNMEKDIKPILDNRNMVLTMANNRESRKLSKDELIEMIISGGLIEDFISWTRGKGLDIDIGVSLRDIDYEILYEYAKERNLIAEGDEQRELSIPYEFEKHEPREVRPRTPPRRKQ